MWEPPGGSNLCGVNRKTQKKKEKEKEKTLILVIEL